MVSVRISSIVAESVCEDIIIDCKPKVTIWLQFTDLASGAPRLRGFTNGTSILFATSVQEKKYDTKYSTKMQIVLQMVRCSDVTRYAAMQGLHFRACLHKLKAIGGGTEKATRNLCSDQIPIQQLRQLRGPVSVTVHNFSYVISFFQRGIAAFHMEI